MFQHHLHHQQVTLYQNLKLTLYYITTFMQLV